MSLRSGRNDDAAQLGAGAGERRSGARGSAPQTFGRRATQKDSRLIDDSEPWRSDLKRYAGSIDRARKRPVRGEQAFARLERDHMYGYFAVRRLMECFKLSSSTLSLTLPLVAYPFRNGSHLTFMNADELDRHFDLGRPTRVTMPLRDLSNQIIHSYVFVFALRRPSYLAGVFVSSEFRRRRTLAYVPAWRTARVFRRVAEDWPNETRLRHDPVVGDYQYWARMRRQ